MTLPATLSASEAGAIQAFVEAVRAELGPELRDVRLFGSRARGQGHERSDIDIVCIVGTNGREQRHVIYDLAFDIGLAHGVELAPLVIDESRLRELRARERLIAREIDTEGIPL